MSASYIPDKTTHSQTKGYVWQADKSQILISHLYLAFTFDSYPVNAKISA